MGGIHFERSIRDWDYIYENLSAIQYPAVDSLSIEVVADGGISPVYEVRRLKSFWTINICHSFLQAVITQ
ncbi:MAG: hypothetical protein IPG53_10375 [Ignavibacteriales bacterium]|nr:hypothetical protein [Ignavibacteriales bacterium]